MPFSNCALHRVVLVCVGIITGCASPQTRTPVVNSQAASDEAFEQKKLVVKSQVDNSNRLARVSHGLLVAGADFCKETVASKYGFLVLNASAFGDEYEAAAKAEGFGTAVAVSYVIPQSKSADAGLQVGDQIQRVGGWDVPINDRDSLNSVIEKLRATTEQSAGTLPLTVLRNGVSVDIDIPSERACDYTVELGQDDVVNAYADGSKIVIEKGMTRFARDDDELALVVSHELAHNAMGHMSSKRTNAVMGGALGLLVDVALAAATGGAYSEASFTRAGMQAGAGSYSVEFEQEADYVGLYILKRAGYDVTEAPDFWRRMAIENPESIEIRKSHPTTPERFIALEAATKEIEEKSKSASPMVPEMRH